ncbi:MAG: glycosyltransferase family 39 protein [Chloroflexi bacterium]|nr:glycosyltransferase family 39 protein [Chloroflexota bacterium]
MFSISSLGILLSLALFIISVGGMIFLASQEKDSFVAPELANVALDESEKETQDISYKEKLKEFLKIYRWEIFLGSVFALIAIFAWIYAPPRLNGEIAIYPNTPGRPFYNLRWGRDFIRINYDALWRWGSLITSGLLLIIIFFVFKKRSRKGASFVLLAASMNLAVLGQWLILVKGVDIENLHGIGRNLYFVAIAGFVLWAWLSRKYLSVLSDIKALPVKKGVEITFIIMLLLLSGFTRLYTLRSLPYGIEGDEAKWTSEAVNLGIAGTPDSSGEYHRDALPVSFYLQMPLHRLLGPSLFAARLTVVLLSVIGTLLFYWFLRQISNFPIAALASSLLSISVFDISASRLANVESFVKMPPILALALLAWAIKSQRWQVYGLSGIALALGMLTYDTVWPLSLVMLLIALIELARQKEPFLERTKSIAALLAPTIISLPLLLPYLSSRLSYYEFDEKGFETETSLKVWTYLSKIISTWFVELRLDFLYNRPGPLLNAILLPFLVLGIVIALFQIRKKASLWNFLWVLFFIFPIPVLANSSMGRVYYPALPAVYFFVGLGIFFFWMALDNFLGEKLRPLLIVATLLPLVWLPLANLYIYFNEVSDYTDRQMRREIGEFAAQIADEETLLLLSANLGANTAINNEYQMLELYMLKNIPAEKLENAYDHIAPDDLLNEITLQKDFYKNIEILFNQGETPEVADALRACYPTGKITEGKFFTRYKIENISSAEIGCISASLRIEEDENNSIYWVLEGEETREISVSCERRATDFQWLEAENLFKSPGWQTEINFASDWMGTGFARDNYGSAPLRIRYASEISQDVYVWIRHYKRSLEETPTYFLAEEISYPFADVDENQLNAWRWERIGPIKVDGEVEFFIDHKGDAEHFMAIFIDSIVISTETSFSPEKDIWQETPPLLFDLNKAQNEGSLELELSQGFYQCVATVDTNIPVIEMHGETILESNQIEVDIR